MTKFYALQIRMKKITIDDVPDESREAVREYMESKGWST